MASCQPPCSDYPGTYGNFVLIKHGEGYSTLYAHLDSIAGGIRWYPPEQRWNQDFDSWTPVSRGEVIGYVGYAGVTPFHLHFEAATNPVGDYTAHVNGRVDPYDIYQTPSHYPPSGSDYAGCGPNHLWTSCPPLFPPDGETLSVSLSADPSSGTAPLNSVDLAAIVSGSATGSINYTFYCDRSDSATNITPGWAAKFDGVFDNPKSAIDVCDYSTAGTYTAKVIAERGSAPPAEARVTITVNAPPSLSNGYVEPQSGDTSTPFYYYVTYFDPDGDSPTVKQVYVDDIPHIMDWYSYFDSSIIYRYGPTYLSPGTHNYYFYFEDGRGGTVQLPGSGTYSGPSVSDCTTPGIPSNPSPTSGAPGVSIDADLDWSDASGATSYDVYFGTSSSPPYYGNTASSFYSLPTLNYSTHYYWKIVAKNSCGQTSGLVWDFTTHPTPAFDCATVSEIPQGECQGLVALYNSTNGPNWINRSGWLVTNTPCTWYGAGCTAGHVTWLGLDGNQLSGSIPPELGNLTSLANLYLNSNQLSGSIPPQLGNLTNLQWLHLNSNQLSGGIPPELGNLTNLQGLYLYSNQLSGSIPPQLGNLTRLLDLILKNNQLSGNIPPELGNLTNLLQLYLNFNQLSGSIPPQLGNLTNLHGLVLSDNQLSGSIPAQLGNVAGLRWLWLQNNQLGGGVPPQLGNLASLGVLYLDHNPLSGALPQSLTNLDLTSFWFDSTDLCEPGDAAFQSWLASIPDLRRTGVICAPTVSWHSPSATGKTHDDWTSPGNAFVSDNHYTTVEGESKNQDYYDFDFDIPANAAINGIEVTVEGHGEATGSDQILVEIWSTSSNPGRNPPLGEWGTRNDGQGGWWVLGDGSDATARGGGPSDLWGVSWQPSDFSNEDFLLRIRSWSNRDKLYVDHIRAKVHYTTTPEYSRYDFNCDCVIDVLDIMAVSSRWRCRSGDGCYNPLYDLDGDGDIDIVDIMTVASRWGCECGDECYGAGVSAISQVEPGPLMAPAAVRLEPGSSMVTASEIFTVAVEIEGAVDLGGLQLALNFDPAVLHVHNVTLGNFLGSTGRNMAPLGPEVDNDAGTITFGGFSFGSQPGASGDGVLAILTLAAQGAGNSPLHLENVRVADTGGQAQTVTVEDGRVLVAVPRRIYLPLTVGQ